MTDTPDTPPTEPGTPDHWRALLDQMKTADTEAVFDYPASSYPASSYRSGGFVRADVEAAARAFVAFDDGRTHFDDDRWVRGQLARFTYKPGWVFDTYVFPGASLTMWGAHVQAVFEAPDTRNPGKTVKVAGRVPFRQLGVELRNEDLFARGLLEHIISMERHEAREWLRRDGAIYDDPHK